MNNFIIAILNSCAYFATNIFLNNTGCEWRLQSTSALSGRMINNFVECWCLVASGGLEIWVPWISFLKSNTGCPPPTGKGSKISKNLGFWWSIPQKWTSIGHFGAREHGTIRTIKFCDEIRLLRSLRPLRLLRL